jgi:hypothetical protein
MQPGFDPSKLDPKTLMELSNLVRELPPHQLNRMQSLMHNMMAGFDVKKDMEEFERTLPPGFREKLAGVMVAMGPMDTQQAVTSEPVSSGPGGAPMDVSDARLTVLRAVAAGAMSPEEAEKILFPG